MSNVIATTTHTTIITHTGRELSIEPVWRRGGAREEKQVSKL